MNVVERDKKKKRPVRRRWRMVLMIGVSILVLMFALYQLQRLAAQEAAYQHALDITAGRNRIYSPDGARYATVAVNSYESAGFGFLFDPASRAAMSLNYPENQFHTMHWSADSRYAILNNSNHYGAGNLTIYDMEQRKIIDTPGYNACAMFNMSHCGFEDVREVAPVSPLIITADGTLINLPDGSNHDLSPDLPGQMMLAYWSPAERLFFVTLQLDDYGAKSGILHGYFAGTRGENPVEVLTVRFASDADRQPLRCVWYLAELSGVWCQIAAHTYRLPDPHN